MARKSSKKWLWIGLAVVVLAGGIYGAVIVAQRQSAGKKTEASTAEEAPLSVPDIDGPWELAQDQGATIAIPKDWDKLDKFSPQVLFFRKSNGKGGVPATDEAGAELQAQIIVEKIRMEPPLEDSANVVADRLTSETQIEIISRPLGERIKLTDGTDAFIMHTEIIKLGTQRNLLIKLLAKSDPHSGFVVTGSIVAGKESKIPTYESAQGKWLRALVTSLVFDASKLDARKVNRAYDERDRK